MYLAILTVLTGLGSLARVQGYPEPFNTSITPHDEAISAPDTCPTTTITTITERIAFPAVQAIASRPPDFRTSSYRDPWSNFSSGGLLFDTRRISTTTTTITKTLSYDSVVTNTDSLSVPPNKEGNGDCSLRPLGHGPKVADIASIPFHSANPEFSTLAKGATVPNDYKEVYMNRNSSNAPGVFLTYKDLRSYSVQDCAQYCNQETRCRAFNIFFERIPTFHLGPNCRNAPSSTMINCAL